MSGILQQISDIEAEMARTQRNKATEHHLGRLKAKLAKLKSEVMAGPKGGGGKAGDGFDVTKSGDTRVGLIGFPSVGKSTLLTKLTGTESAVAAYEVGAHPCRASRVTAPATTRTFSRSRTPAVTSLALPCSLLAPHKCPYCPSLASSPPSPLFPAP
jgi:50S ribosome-binding GTPase